MFAKTLTFINTYRWRFYTLWSVPAFLFWLWLGFYAAGNDRDTPGGLYLFTTLTLWFFIHLIPVILLAAVLALFRWRTRSLQRRSRLTS